MAKAWIDDKNNNAVQHSYLIDVIEWLAKEHDTVILWHHLLRKWWVTNNQGECLCRVGNHKTFLRNVAGVVVMRFDTIKQTIDCLRYEAVPDWWKEMGQS